MSATYLSRIQRLRRLQGMLPHPGTPEGECLIISELLDRMPDGYGDGSEPTRRRAMQRDLDELAAEGLIEVINPGGKPQRYRQAGKPLLQEEADWLYLLSHLHDQIQGLLPPQRLKRVWDRLQIQLGTPLLAEGKRRQMPDTLRLCPPAIHPGVLEAVITALQKDCALEVRYEDARGQRATARLHPQALLQRGPIPYLFALKHDETEPVRTYALHRMCRARALLTVPVRPAEGFNLDQALASSQVDSGRGQVIDLELRVRGYAAEMLRVCPITPTQRMEEEPANSSFLARVRVQVPETGALLRWLLGLGDNVEVVAPAGLRQVMGEQIAKMARHYAPLSVTGEVAGQKAERHQASAGHGKPSPSCEDHVGARR